MLKKNKYGHHWDSGRDLSNDPNKNGVKVNIQFDPGLPNSWSHKSEYTNDKIKTIKDEK